jgi:hypothetical protein
MDSVALGMAAARPGMFTGGVAGTIPMTPVAHGGGDTHYHTTVEVRIGTAYGLDDLENKVADIAARRVAPEIVQAISQKRRGYGYARVNT